MSVGRITHTMVTRRILADLSASTERLSSSHNQLSSGKQISRPSDDPYGTSKALELRQGMEGARQHQRNAQDAMGWTEATEAALARMTDVVHRARELTIQGGTDTSSPHTRDAIAIEIENLAEELKQHGNASYRGTFLLAGTRTDQPPYAAGDAYGGDQNLIAREIGPGVSMQINTDARSVLGDGQAAGDDKLLDVLRDIAANLRAGTQAASDDLRTGDLKRLDENLDNLLLVRAENGARQNRLETALGRLGQVEEITLAQLSQTEDADMAKVMITFSQQQAAYQAALKAGANLVQGSLMDFLR